MNKKLKEFNEKVDELNLGIAGAKVKDYARTLIKSDDSEKTDEQQEKKESIKQKSDRPKSMVELGRSKRIIK